MGDGEVKKARLEEILDGLEEVMDSVRGEMEEFKAIRALARGEEGVLAGAKFYVDIGSGAVEIPAPTDLSDDVLESLMDQQGSKVADMWVKNIKPLVDEAVGICKQASDRGQEEEG